VKSRKSLSSVELWRNVNRKFLGNTENSPRIANSLLSACEIFKGKKKKEEKSFECLSLFNVNESS
jgi:hypothetical protein